MNPRLGVGVFVFNNRGQFILGKRQGSHGSGTWALPGGHLEFGESFEDCGSREVLEETDLTVHNMHYLTATNDVMEAENKHYVTIFVGCHLTDEPKQPQIMEPEKCAEWQWVSLEEVRSDVEAHLAAEQAGTLDDFEGRRMIRSTITKMPPPDAPASEAPPGSVNINSLSVPQLRSLQTRLSSELEHLTTSHTKLRAAQSRFRDCIRSINEGVIGSEKKGTSGKEDILVPLTSSLYVRGKLTDREKVLVDVGTGFYVEKGQTPAKAIAFYEDKVKGLETNLTELEKIVQTKSGQQRLFEDALRQKLLSENAPSSSAAGAGGG
ncbi:subunit of tubulin prefoldin [Aspergillus nanangensis]|uniref:Subunit of tubulin prefoldin n=1 Tax=Aspergillus nanangensis TaxID=2582783 RepID=A0AAD4GT69_ASPNN|nr:subunit of tubulin prefoldin [Aspergillus nanangensis]